MHIHQNSERKKLTVVWHVDDIKISYMKSDVVGEMIAKPSNQYGNDTEITIHRGKLHDYSLTRLDHRKKGKLNNYMKKYLSKFLEEIPEKYKGHAVTSAVNYLFEMNKMT